MSEEPTEVTEGTTQIPNHYVNPRLNCCGSTVIMTWETDAMLFTARYQGQCSVCGA